MDDVPWVTLHHLALQDLKIKKESCRKREFGMRKKARVIALILTKITCASSHLCGHGTVI